MKLKMFGNDTTTPLLMSSSSGKERQRDSGEEENVDENGTCIKIYFLPF